MIDEPASTSPLLRVRNLSKHFETHVGKGWRRKVEVFKALDDVSFDLRAGETLGIVGESGSGKTTAARCILRAVQPTSGSVIFTNNGTSLDLATLPERDLKPLRQQMQMIFQDPFSSLNPRMTVGDIIGEPLLIHGIGSRRQRIERVAEMLEKVGLQPDHMYRYPHAFSGGQRQRIAIARAVVLRPEILVLDEPTSALDVSVQQQVLAILTDLQKHYGMSYVFISHDLAVVRAMSHRVLVMKDGAIVEQGEAEALFAAPREKYTQALLAAAGA